ncbi:Response regulator MprA [Brevundimonas sp. NIBR10]|uniref:response regulator n=1 Tax=Brevundimonas sp. NIBR10 TaxID=3015997 RepID=UPI0022F1B516|nr:response regulator [Brevundimonas sp. NIBR10]WGM45349.1 Response regulator MprA [Brevundimonas sp. NIBR10]
MALAVLVVDGDIDALASVRAVLSGEDYAVREAPNGRRALQRIMADPPNLLITEILMPDGDGIELISAARTNYPEMRIIAVSNRRFLGDLDLLNLASKLGANAVLNKPVQVETLIATIKRLLGTAAP